LTNTVQAAREALGIRLRDLRKDARLSGRELAALTGWHFTKVSKIEHGRTMPTEDDLELWCFHCRAQNELPDLIATGRSIEKMYAEIKHLMRTGTARYQQEILEDYARSRRFRHFQVALLPGILQTHDYASAVLTDAAAMLGHPADIGPTVSARQERAKLMLSGDKLFDFVLLEGVLTSCVAPPEVMHAQLRHLLTILPMPRVHLGIIPALTRLYMPMCGFVIVDDRYVRTETFSALVQVTQPHEIAIYARVFDHYARLAVYHEQARALILRAIREFEQLRETV
jgi:transcriptional regulator with XRE-family HTH domain